MDPRGEAAGPESEPTARLPVPATIGPVLRAGAARSSWFRYWSWPPDWADARVRASRVNEPSESAVMTDAAASCGERGRIGEVAPRFTGDVASPPYDRVDTPIERSGGTESWPPPPNLMPGIRGRSAADRCSGSIRPERSGRCFPSKIVCRLAHAPYSAPWSISDYRLYSDHETRLIAVAAHHYDWWPSIVTVLDGQWRRKGSFVHAGWVERIRWRFRQSPGDRGVLEPEGRRDGGPAAMPTPSTGNRRRRSHGDFDCAACGPGRPVRYVVMPRSEVNRVSAAPFNRTSVEVRPGSLIATTLELPDLTQPASAIYEFTLELDLLHASYSDRYWDAHRELERAGKITHTRQRLSGARWSPQRPDLGASDGLACSTDPPLTVWAALRP